MFTNVNTFTVIHRAERVFPGFVKTIAYTLPVNPISFFSPNLLYIWLEHLVNQFQLANTNHVALDASGLFK